MNLPGCNLFSGGFIICLLAPWAGFSQSTLTGKITDRLTGEPVPYANVFFSHTTIGSSTLEDGTFMIRNIPNGKYDLMVYVVGYRRFQKQIELQDSPYTLDIRLHQDTVNLAPVTVYADQSDKKIFYPTFQKYFLGESKNARKCKIINPEILHFYYDKKAKYLAVHASQPIAVENSALGYRIYFLLDRFELDFNTSTKVIEGIPRFEELPFRSRKDSVSIVKRRTQAYRGSLNHFIRSLYTQSLDNQGFVVSMVDSVSLREYPVQQAKLYPFDVTSHVRGALVKTFDFKGTLKVEYVRESEPWEYMHNRISSQQTSFVKFKNRSLTLFENGYYTDQLGIFLEGYFMWEETAGNMLPMGYRIPAKQKRK